MSDIEYYLHLFRLMQPNEEDALNLSEQDFIEYGWQPIADLLLKYRSEIEHEKAQLSKEQLDELQKSDAYWKAHPQGFNIYFAEYHKDYWHKVVGVTDRQVHWWYWPLSIDKESDS